MPNKPKYRAIKKLWPGKTVFIIGGGGSLKLDAGLPRKEIKEKVVFPAISEYLKPIHNERVLGVNNAFELGPWVDACFFGDEGWFRRNRFKLVHFAGYKIHNCSTITARGCIAVYRGEPYGLESKPDRICWNNNSGAAAINVAVHLGAKRIVLLGFDMKVKPAEIKYNNWHNLHKDKTKDWNQYPEFIKAFPYIKVDAENMGVEIINATPCSALTEFPKMTFKEAVNGLASAKAVA